MTRTDSTALVDPTATIGAGSSIWGLAHIRERASVGAGCSIGRGVLVDVGVTIGDRCKVQDNALLYSPASVADGVFIGPAVILTNDPRPRAVNADGSVKSAGDWTPVGVTLEVGSAIGARSLVLGGVRVGAWAMVGAGAVVTHDVPPYALVLGAPARQVAWVGRSGATLVQQPDGSWSCPETGELFLDVGGALVPASA